MRLRDIVNPVPAAPVKVVNLGGGGDDGPADHGAWPPVRWREPARLSPRWRRAIRLPNGLDADAYGRPSPVPVAVARSTLAWPSPSMSALCSRTSGSRHDGPID